MDLLTLRCSCKSNCFDIATTQDTNFGRASDVSVPSAVARVRSPKLFKLSLDMLKTMRYTTALKGNRYVSRYNIHGAAVCNHKKKPESHTILKTYLGGEYLSNLDQVTTYLLKTFVLTGGYDNFYLKECASVQLLTSVVFNHFLPSVNESNEFVHL